jgi:hypothetical protein
MYLHFFRSSGYTYGPAAFDLGNLADYASDRAGRPRYQDGLALFGLAYVQQAEISRHARHTQGTDVGGQFHHVGIDGNQPFAIGNGILLYASPTP